MGQTAPLQLQMGPPKTRPFHTLSLFQQTSHHKSSKMGYEDSVYLAKLAEQAERYEEMVENMKSVPPRIKNSLSKSEISCPLPTRTLLVPAVPRGELLHRSSRRRNLRETRPKLLSLRSTAKRSRPSLPRSVRIFLRF